MLVKNIAATLASVVIIFVISTPLAAEKLTPGPVPIEMWRTGDDALTQEFWKNLVSVFDKSEIFISDRSNANRKFILTLTTNIDWKIHGGRERIMYSIKFDYGSTLLIHGDCWEDRMSDCADKVLKDAIAFASKNRGKPSPKPRRR